MKSKITKSKTRGAKSSFTFKIAIKFVIVLFFFLILVLSLSFSFKRIAGSSLFEIRRVKIKGDTGWLEQSVRFLIGENLFRTDLEEIEARLKSEHREIEKILLSKLWPDTIYVKFSLRQPCALIKGRHDYLIDSKGFILAEEKYKGKIEDLPSISGLILGKPVGGRSALELDEKLTVAFNILELFSPVLSSRGYRLCHVNVRRTSESSFFISKQDEKDVGSLVLVKVGEGPYQKKLEILKVFLDQASFEWTNINYIDLRFKEPIVGLKNG